MRSRSVLVLLILLFLSWNSGCENTVEPRSGTTGPIEGRIFFDVIEGYHGYDEITDPVPFLNLTTEKIYGCGNYSISASVEESQGGAYIVRIDKILKPSVCITSLGPAQYRSGLWLPPGRHGLEFLTPLGTSSYLLDVTESRIQISSRDNGPLVPDVRLYWRHPRNSFAFVAGGMDSTVAVFATFVDSLLTIPTIREFTFPDSGAIPYPRSAGGYYVDLPARYFMYGGDTALEAVRSMFKRFSRNQFAQPGTDAYIVTWRNRWFLSWM